jgi:hypothetical protein
MRIYTLPLPLFTKDIKSWKICEILLEVPLLLLLFGENIIPLC